MQCPKARSRPHLLTGPRASADYPECRAPPELSLCVCGCVGVCGYVDVCGCVWVWVCVGVCVGMRVRQPVQWPAQCIQRDDLGARACIVPRLPAAARHAAHAAAARAEPDAQPDRVPHAAVEDAPPQGVLSNVRMPNRI